MDRNRILTVGPRYYQDNSKTGGIVVLFENWIEYCKKGKYAISIIDTTKANYSNNIVKAYLSIMFRFFINLRSSDSIFIHGTFKDYLFIAPIFCVFAKLFNKKLYLRKFAGDFEVRYNHSSIFKKVILSTLLKKADITFWETKSLVKFGKEFNCNSIWFPNVRNQVVQPKNIYTYSKNFVFVSKVCKQKGVDILLEVFKGLSLDYNLDIFGPLEGYSMEDFDVKNVSYKGVLTPEDVPSVLKKYDFLVLPSYWEGEGYPGIILEALSIGVPVVATMWGGIPEVIIHNYNGFLVPPKNIDSLRKVIMSISSIDYQRMSENALASFEQFDANKVNDRIIKCIM